ncbi:DUF6339 family protein [Streptomyces sp. DSM 41982]|uniref:DUF6339 family protein n=1 Tax=Streptomyces evansiae TaxID=3075535 RepID=A0ABD5E844_9ACTN|nr:MULTISPECIES: DUF6339 family protein [unclassified Streptomyces]MDT0417594.1 DUF6339 family protein [Streptomyces sp. DSM 41982]SCD37886.1 hypothetical protein GA0115246_101009 [Streptomyces sp. SolWspMP-sol7th]
MNTTAMTAPEPGRLGRLSDAVAARAITPSVLRGVETVPSAALLRQAEAVGDDGERWTTGAVVELLKETRARFDDTRPTESDAWLAPRLHWTLRLTRAEAADSGLWNFLALCLSPEYVQWRWRSKDGAVGQVARFTGPWATQAFSRLWWAAELFRDGENYAPAELACSDQDVLNTVLRQRMIQHRPAAQALLRLRTRGSVRTGRDMNAAAKAANAAFMLVHEALAPDEPPDAEVYAEWLDAAGQSAVRHDTLPRGPRDGSVPSASAEALADWFAELFESAPVRGREREGEG